MATTQMWTYADAIEHALDYVGAGSDDKKAGRDARRAVQTAYRELANARRWTQYYARTHITTSAPYSTGTISYSNSTRAVTLASGTWPTWAAFGTLVISNVAYEIDTRDSDSQVTLTSVSNPGADVASGTSYSIYRDTYPLPTDFQAVDNIMVAGSGVPLSYLHPRHWIERQRYTQSPSLPHSFTIRGDPNYMNALAITLAAAPDAVYQLDMLYQRRPRQLVIDDYHTGTATATASSASVTGSGTTWLSTHAGAIIRFSSDATNAPTGMSGSNPPALERTVQTFTSTTAISLDETASSTLTGVKYIISDPIDIEDGAMLQAFMRGVEKEMSMGRVMKDRASPSAAYRDALDRAKAADSRFFGVRGAYGYMPVSRTENPVTGADA